MRRELILCADRPEAWSKARWAVTLRKVEGGYQAFDSYIGARKWDQEHEASAAAPAPVEHALSGIATEANGVYRWTCTCGNSGMPMFEESSALQAHERHVRVYAQKEVA